MIMANANAVVDVVVNNLGGYIVSKPIKINVISEIKKNSGQVLHSLNKTISIFVR